MPGGPPNPKALEPLAGRQWRKARILVLDPHGRTSAEVRRAVDPLANVDLLRADSRDAAVHLVRTLAPEVMLVDLEDPAAAEVIGALTALPGMPQVVGLYSGEPAEPRTAPSGSPVTIRRPITPEKLAAALIECAMQAVSAFRAAYRLSGGGPQMFCVRVGRRYVFFEDQDVSYAEAARNYVRLHTARGSVTARISLSALLDRLDPTSFCQIHRSTVVNLRCVREVRSAGGGDYTARMANGSELRVSRSYAARLLDSPL